MTAVLIRLITAVLFSAGVVRAAERGAEWSVVVDMQVIAVAPETGLQLVPKLRNEKTFDDAFGMLQRMVSEEAAELLGWPVVRTRNGVDDSIHTESESALELRYPTEFGPITAPPPFGIPMGFVRGPDSIYGLFSNWGMMCPTAFDTRNTGVSLKTEVAVPEPGDWIHLMATPDSVQLLRFHETPGMTSPAGTTAVAIQPDFTVAKLTASLSVRNGRRILLGTTVQRDPAPRLILFLLRASACHADATHSEK